MKHRIVPPALNF